MPKRVAFTVSFNIPAKATSQECREYIEDAVSSWRGSLRPPRSLSEADPGDPMWDLDRSTITVTRRVRHAARPRTII